MFSSVNIQTDNTRSNESTTDGKGSHISSNFLQSRKQHAIFVRQNYTSFTKTVTPLHTAIASYDMHLHLLFPIITVFPFSFFLDFSSPFGFFFSFPSYSHSPFSSQFQFSFLLPSSLPPSIPSCSLFVHPIYPLLFS